MNTTMKAKRCLFYIAILICCSTCFYSCNKDYITGGTLEDVNMYKSLSTTDVIAKLPGLDTLAQLINAAGIKDQINAQGTTFFALPNGAITSYLNAKTFILKNTVGANYSFTLDSLLYNVKNNVNGTRDSLLMYLIKTTTTPTNTTEVGTRFPTGLIGDSVVVSYESVKDGSLGYTSIVTTLPRVVYFTTLWGAYYPLSTDNTIADIPAEQGSRTLVQTSFINTQNGVVNVLRSGKVTIASDYSSMSISGNILFYWGNSNRPH